MIERMELGQLIDYIVEYNEIHDINQDPGTGNKEEKPKRRMATQADIDAFWG